ncbi:MAG: SMI1/KNR4 family protein [Chthoniobacter sp.]|uniref:SMI1/KNR4 family protein n=1 Tax=Chthoniobacter sp. TaxID=2510640 RepID=UPI0032A894DC
MDISQIEVRFRIQLPERHRQALGDPSDPIHQWCDFLVLSTPYPLLDFALRNEELRTEDPSNPWPDFLIAFASNGCGDYWAYDTRRQPPTILYIDPDKSVVENLAAKEPYGFDTFDSWYADYARRKAEGFNSELWWKNRNA